MIRFNSFFVIALVWEHCADARTATGGTLIRRTLTFPATLVLLLSFPTLCSAGSYTVTDLRFPGATGSVATGINASGQVVGYSQLLGDDGYQYPHAFMYDGAMHDLGTLGGAGSAANGINASGQVVGSSGSLLLGNDGYPVTHAFMYDGTMHDLGTLGGTTSSATGINVSGQVVGSSLMAGDQVTHAFMYDGTMHDLGTLGGTTSSATGINVSGQVVGSSLMAGDQVTHAFMYDGTMHDLGTLGGTNSFANGVNDSGQITGSAFPGGDSLSDAFLYDGIMHDLRPLGQIGGGSRGLGINASGQVVGISHFANQSSHGYLYDSVLGMVDLNSLIDPATGWLLSTPRAINDVGQIAGNGQLDGEARAFLLTPTPEPSTLALAMLGFVGLAAWRWCKRR